MQFKINILVLSSWNSFEKNFRLKKFLFLKKNNIV